MKKTVLKQGVKILRKISMINLFLRKLQNVYEAASPIFNTVVVGIVYVLTDPFYFNLYWKTYSFIIF